MSRVQIKEVGSVKLDRVNKVLAGIPGGVMSASYNALKRAGARAKTEAGRFVAQEYVITKGVFMKNVTVTTQIAGSYGGVNARSSSSGSAVSLNINFAGTVIPLIEFQVRYSKSGSLTAQVKRGGGGTIQNAFAARVYGPMRVFERVGKARLPIDEKFGPSTAQMMGNEQIVDAMTDVIKDTFDERIEHEINRLLNGFGGQS